MVSEKSSTKEWIIIAYFFLVFFVTGLVFCIDIYEIGKHTMEISFPALFSMDRWSSDKSIPISKFLAVAKKDLILAVWHAFISGTMIFLHVFLYIRYRKAR